VPTSVWQSPSFILSSLGNVMLDCCPGSDPFRSSKNRCGSSHCVQDLPRPAPSGLPSPVPSCSSLLICSGPGCEVSPFCGSSTRAHLSPPRGDPGSLGPLSAAPALPASGCGGPCPPLCLEDCDFLTQRIFCGCRDLSPPASCECPLLTARGHWVDGDLSTTLDEAMGVSGV
jgi:hypothetical protein